MLYQIRWITQQNKSTAIILQSANGPCPIIAIVNALSLREHINIPPESFTLSSDEIFSLLNAYLHRRLEKLITQQPAPATSSAARTADNALVPTSPTSSNELVVATAIKLHDDTVSALSRLECGLDVNCRFCRPNEFEYTAETAVFDAFDVRLCHGWCVDEEDAVSMAVMKSLSYNAAVNRLTTECESDDTAVQNELAVIQHWLNATATQLTYTGLTLLFSHVREGEFAILFRNNHFSVLHKARGRLFDLVTEESIIEANSRICWSELSSMIDGDDTFFDDAFVLIDGGDKSAALQTQTPAKSIQVPPHYLESHSASRQQPMPAPISASQLPVGAAYPVHTPRRRRRTFTIRKRSSRSIIISTTCAHAVPSYMTKPSLPIKAANGVKTPVISCK